MKKSLLIVTPRYPYPVIGGDRIRIYYLCKALSQHFEVSLLSLCETREEMASPLPEDGVFSSIERIYYPKWRSWINALLAIPTRSPLQVAYYGSSLLARRIKAGAALEPELQRGEGNRMFLDQPGMDAAGRGHFPDLDGARGDIERPSRRIDEVMVRRGMRVEPGPRAVHGHFAQQAGAGEGMKRVVDRGQRQRRALRRGFLGEQLRRQVAVAAVEQQAGELETLARRPEARAFQKAAPKG